MKRWLLGLGTLITLLCLVVAPSIRADNEEDDSKGNEAKIRIGYNIMQMAGIPLKLAGKNRALVGLGSYIVNAESDCMGCHSNPEWAPGGDPFLGQPKQISRAGYLVGGAPLFGPFLPRNLTPDKTGKPAGLTLEEFMLVLRTGKDLDNVPPHVPSMSNDLLQIMPWPVFGNMTDRDLKAIYEFLSAIPCLEGGVAGRCGP